MKTKLGFPTVFSEPMHYANELGLDYLVERITHYRDTLGEYGAMWFEPSDLLNELAGDQKKFAA